MNVWFLAKKTKKISKSFIHGASRCNAQDVDTIVFRVHM